MAPGPSVRPAAATMPSVLDRLLDQVPVSSGSNPPSRRAQVAAVKRTLQRDLEWLLNTRRRNLGDAGKDLPELKNALIAYGIPDFTALDLSSEARQLAFARALETVIRTFEPRLSAVSVVLADRRPTMERRLRFRIEALIRVEPGAEPVIFESLLDPATQTFSIRAADHE